MSYAQAPGLQAAVYALLTGDAALAALVGTHIYDMAPEGAAVPSIYVALGPEDVRAASDSGGPAAVFTLTVSVVGTGIGFAAIKQAAAQVCSVLADSVIDLPGGHVTGLQFRTAKARLGDDPNQRLIDLIFRTRVEDIAAA